MTDLQAVREVIELFTIHYFDDLEMAGTVKLIERTRGGYLSIDFTSRHSDDDIDKFHQSLFSYLKQWAQNNSSGFQDIITISSFTIEYLLPDKDGSKQNKSKNIKLFFLPSHYYSLKPDGSIQRRSKFKAKFLAFWNNLFLRNTLLTTITTITFVIIGIYKLQSDKSFFEKLSKSYDYINIACGIIASLVLGYLVTKVMAIRQDKQRHTADIKNLSNKLTYFRNVCYDLAGDHTYWSPNNPNYNSYQYAKSIKNDISFDEYYYPNLGDDVEYAKFTSFYREDLSHNIVSLILQLEMMAGDSMLHSRLTYTEFPPNYIYSHDEMKKFALFTEANLIWYCGAEANIFPKIFPVSYAGKEMVKDINRIYPETPLKGITNENLQAVSLDFQYNIIPRLYHLTKVVGSDLPVTINYFVTSFILLLACGVILPTLAYVFVDTGYALLFVFPAIGIIAHILLSLKSILRAENTLDSKYDFL
jgi:hypothetical protein